MTIRLRLLFWYFSVTLIILLLFSLGSYWGMQRVLFQALDKELIFVSDSVERSYEPVSGVFRLAGHHSSLSGPYREFYLMVYGAKGERVYESPVTRSVSLDIPLPEQESKVGYTIRTTIKHRTPFLHVEGKRAVTFRVISHKLFHNSRLIGWAVTGLSIENIEKSMQHLLTVLLSGMTGAVLLIGFGGYFLTRKVLHPIDTITRKAKDISHTSLDERIEIRNKDDELGRLTDVLNNLLERLQKAFLSQQTFLADAAHELKTPLSILRSHWESEINNPDLSIELKERLVQDVETITRLNHLINNLLLLSQTESIQSSFEFSSVELEELIKEVVLDTDVLAQMKSQQLEIIKTEPAVVHGDRTRLYQLLFNLIDNAIKYTPDGGAIRISQQLQNGGVMIAVIDNGPGISQEDLPFIFERFYRVKKDRARKTGGSGLGLAICRLIAESHHGEITVASKPGEGSTFRVTLPPDLSL